MTTWPETLSTSLQRLALAACLPLAGCGLPDWQLAPDRQEFFFQRGIDQYERGDYAAATRSFSKFLSFAPDPHGYWLRGRSFHELGDPKRALRDYEEALALDPHHSTIRRALGWLHFTSGDFAAAATEYEQSFYDHRGEPESLSFAAWSALGAGHYSEAVDLALQAQSEINWYDAEFFDGNDAAYNTIVAYLGLQAQGHSARADAYLTLALRKADPNAWPYTALLYFAGKASEAELLYSAEGRGATTEARTYLAFDALRRGDTAAAQEHLDWIADEGDNIYYEYYVALALRDGRLIFPQRPPAETPEAAPESASSIHP